MRVLIIGHSYWPRESPRAIRWTAIARHWASLGHDVHVLAGPVAGRPALEIDQGVRIRRCGATLIEKHQAAAETALVNGHTNGPGWWRQRAQSISRRAWRAVRWPDGECLWYFDARRVAIEMAGSTTFDAMVSVSLPFTSHLVARALRARNLVQRWVVDVGDPFSVGDDHTINNRTMYDRLNRRAERAVFDACSAVAVTNSGTTELYGRVFLGAASKFSVVPPLVSFAESRALVSTVNDGRLRLVYVGSLYRRLRSPDFLLRLFDGLLHTPVGPRLELHVFGKMFDCEEHFAPFRHLRGAQLHLHGLVDHARARQALQEADALVNIGNDTPYQLPSKIVEYASTGKPILNLATRSDDSSGVLLESYPARLLLVDGAEPLDRQVAKLRAFLDTIQMVDPEIVNRWIAPYRLPLIAAAYERLLTAH